MQEPTPELTEQEKVRAATNSPHLSTEHVTLGDRTFPIVDLKYDDYLEFMALLGPFLAPLTAKFTPLKPAISSEDLSAKAILTFCGKSLPEMVRLICSQTDPSITIEDIKSLGKNPFTLALIVMQQIEQNQMIATIASFFGQILPMLQGSRKSTSKITEIRSS